MFGWLWSHTVVVTTVILYSYGEVQISSTGKCGIESNWIGDHSLASIIRLNVPP